MIKFEIVGHSQDLDGTHIYQQNKLYFSNEKGSLVIPDFQREQLFGFEISDNGKLIAISTHPFELNGKLKSDRCYVEVNDLITINKFHFKIHNYKKSEKPLLKNIVNKKVDHLIESKSELISIMKRIRK